MSFIVGWDKRQLSRAGPPLGGLPLVGRRSHSLAGPTLLSADLKASSKALLQSCTISKIPTFVVRAILSIACRTEWFVV